ncbi:hypothetical protein DFH05DRAFT_695083 [Lentinula detonsa]|uniref:Uncharacterized protein n=1 Tax=Lentinula detonsa TaxID=2804962 RepID=A0A9W8P9I5_9AGAR|nr:hypothetical protein DFH05DRAFT_695083 [Lentinula detonsa]
MSESYFQGAHNFNIYDSRFHQTTVYNITNPAMPKAPPGHIQGMTLCPVPTNTFTGREEALTKLEEFFRPGSAAERKKTFLLYGLGGAGKTQLALEFAKRFKERLC